MRDSVREAIRELVIGGELRPGDRLVERQLAERLGVSRVPVREALRQLAHEGLVDERPTRGMVVRRLGDEDVEALFEVRAALESILCRRVVDTASDEGLDRLDEAVRRTDAALARSDRRAAVESNAAFHQVLVELAASPVLTAVMEPVAGPDEVAAEPARGPRCHEHRPCRHRAGPARPRRDGCERLCREHLAASRTAVSAAAGDPAP